MAKVLGTSGRYVSQEAIKLQRRIVTQVFIVVAGLGMMEGIFLSAYVPVWKLSPLLRGFLEIACLPDAFHLLNDLTTPLGNLDHSGAIPLGSKSAYHESGVPLIRSMNVHF